jgi:hypothetical protein
MKQLLLCKIWWSPRQDVHFITRHWRTKSRFWTIFCLVIRLPALRNRLKRMYRLVYCRSQKRLVNLLATPLAGKCDRSTNCPYLWRSTRGRLRCVTWYVEDANHYRTKGRKTCWGYVSVCFVIAVGELLPDMIAKFPSVIAQKPWSTQCHMASGPWSCPTTLTSRMIDAIHSYEGTSLIMV